MHLAQYTATKRPYRPPSGPGAARGCFFFSIKNIFPGWGGARAQNFCSVHLALYNATKRPYKTPSGPARCARLFFFQVKPISPGWGSARAQNFFVVCTWLSITVPPPQHPAQFSFSGRFHSFIMLPGAKVADLYHNLTKKLTTYLKRKKQKKPKNFFFFFFHFCLCFFPE